MEETFGPWVDTQEALEHFNTTKECICGKDDPYPSVGRFYEHYWCSECGRKYVKAKEAERAVAPQKILKTNAEGLVPANSDWDSFNLLTEHALDVQDCIEIHPSAMEASEAWMWAQDGLFIGYLVCKNDLLRAAVIAEGFRQQGHGSKFITTWFEQKEHNTLTVIAFDRTKPFLEEQLEFPIKYR
jgi:hypothetical protein